MGSSIYSNIFEITKENIEQAGGSFSVSKEAFEELSVIHPRDADIFLLSREQDNRLFLEKSYIRLLKRLADERAYENWTGRFSFPTAEFQRLLTMTLVTSPEFAGTDVNVYNNIYSTHNRYGGKLSESPDMLDVKNAERRIRIYNFLRKLYNRLPERIKKLLRKLWKRGR